MPYVKHNSWHVFQIFIERLSHHLQRENTKENVKKYLTHYLPRFAVDNKYTKSDSCRLQVCSFEYLWTDPVHFSMSTEHTGHKRTLTRNT